MTTEVQIKRCSKCQKDLTGAKRLKDAKGNYWCPDCGVGDAKPGASGLVSPCPKCGTPTHTAQLVRDKKSGTYMCENCAAGVKSKGGGSAADEEAARKKKMTIIAILMIIAGVGLYFGLNSLL